MPELITNDGVQLHYLDEGTGPAVVLVAGFTGRLSSWALLTADLLTAGYRVIRFDRRSHGSSDFPAFGQRIARHATDLEQLSQDLALDDAVWVGSSMGASTLLSRVDLTGGHSTRGLVLVDQTPKMVNDDTWDLGMYDLTWSTLAAFVDHFPGTTSAFHVPPPPHVLAMLMEDNAPSYPFDETRALLRDHAVSDWRDVIPRISCPLLAIGGRHSPLWPVASTEWIAEHALRGHAVVLEGSGHAPHLSEPELFSKTLITWMDAL